MNAFRYLYGPVPSRRLGRSLGVDLVPHKVCTYDCIYCQIGETTEKTLLRKEYIPGEEILTEVKAFLSERESDLDHISLAGSGEPTLHSRIRAIIEGIKKMTSVPIAVITNGSLLWKEEVRRDLLTADIVLPSLDAVSSEVFERINRPHGRISVGKMIDGLVGFRKIYEGKIWLEVLFCKGVNDSPDELQKMKEAIGRISPDLIHLNTVVRPPSERSATPLVQKELEKIKTFFGKKALIISEFDRHLSRPERNLKEEIVGILKRRPLSLEDLAKWTGIPREEVEASVKSLQEEGKIKTRPVGNSTYYENQSSVAGHNTDGRSRKLS